MVFHLFDQQGISYWILSIRETVLYVNEAVIDITRRNWNVAQMGQW